MKIRTVLFSLLALLGGCSVTSIGAEERAHHEEAALHKLLDHQASYAALVQILKKRHGDHCNDEATEYLGIVVAKSSARRSRVGIWLAT
jgi:hypothetical protein